MRGADEASQPRFGRDGEAKLIPFLYVARWATTGGRCGVLGSRRVKPRREPQQARQVAASGGVHEGTPMQRSAACLRGGRE